MRMRDDFALPVAEFEKSRNQVILMCPFTGVSTYLQARIAKKKDPTMRSTTWFVSGS